MDKPKKPRRSKKSKGRCPNREKIENGLYLDFEGHGRNKKGDQPQPALCGYRIGGRDPVTLVVFTKALKWAAIDSGLEMQDREEFSKWLLNDLKKGRLLFGYSLHEDKMLRKMSQKDSSKRRKNTLRNYKNIRAIAEEGFKTITPDEFGNSLEEYCELAGIPVPEKYGKGQVTKWLRRVKEHSGTQKGWESAPAEAREQWQLLLAHNRFDVECMYELLKRIKKKADQP